MRITTRIKMTVCRTVMTRRAYGRMCLRNISRLGY